MSKMICENFSCEWVGDEADVLRAPNPFVGRDELIACPKCGCVTLAAACDEPGCDQVASCGTPAIGGYRRTCLDHMPNYANPERK